MLNNRIINHTIDKLPQEQFGFIPGKSTTDAIRVLINNISEALENPKGKLYACFVDFSKAFDSVDKDTLIQKLTCNFNIGGKTLAIIKDILKPNNICISDGLRLSKTILQERGLLQGDSLSPTLFIMYIADLPNSLKENTNNLKLLLYADDLVFFSENRKEIQIGLDNLETYTLSNELDVNLSKTKIMKFRKGGYLCKDDNFKYQNQPVEIVNSYSYLGIKLQTTLTFTEHIKNRKRCSITTINMLKNTPRLSVTAGIFLFNIKIKPVIFYGIHIISKYLKTSHLLEIDKVKSTFLKRLLGVHYTTSSTLCHHLIENSPLSTEICHNLPVQETVKIEYLEILEIKNLRFCIENYTESFAFEKPFWKAANVGSRSTVCRYTSHGFHYLICSNQRFHKYDQDCLCKMCNKKCNTRYHITNCDKVTLSLDDVAQLKQL